MSIVDEEERKRAESDLNQTYILDAGAGTGKTTVLVSRVMNILLNTKSTLDRVVVITFTEKAAGELKFRIREEIDKQLKYAEVLTKEDVIDRFSRAISDIEKAPISTIHSFCASILRERPIEAGLTPNFDVADEFVCSVLFEEGWKKWLEKELSEGSELEKAKALESALKMALKLDDLKNITNQLFDNRDFLEYLKEVKTDSSDDEKILSWLKDAVNSIEKLKKEKDVLDFQDLLLKTRDLLKNNKDVRRYFIDKYDYILVDEFQDTDPLQAEIVFFLAEKEPKADEWNECELKPGKLFLVGDPKQSIYGFRRADIEMYNEVKALIEKQGKIEALKQNFRTVKKIIEWVNNKFSEIIKQSDYQPAYIKIVPYRGDEAQNEHTLVYGLALPIQEEKYSVDVKRKKEAEHVATFIENVVNQWEVWDKHAENWRKLSYGDIALLFLKRTGWKHFEKALKNHQIPYILVGATTFLSTIEIADLINCLKTINNPSDEVAVVGALRSFFFGFSDEEIFLARQNGLDFDYTKPLPKNENVEIFRDAYSILNDLHKKRNEMKISSLILELYTKTMAPAIYGSFRDGEQKVANLMKIVEKARAFDNAATFTFGEFTRYLETQQEAPDGGEEEAMVWEAGDSFVRLMTIHGAKGLEFPMVIIADHTLTAKEKDSNKWKIIFDRKNKMAKLLLNKDQKIEFRDVIEMQESKKLAEFNRLLYVACTRARDYLILPYSPQMNEKQFTFPLFEKMDEHIKWLNPHDLKKQPLFHSNEILQSSNLARINFSQEFRKWEENKTTKLKSIIEPERFKNVTSLHKGGRVSPVPSAEEKRKIGSLVHAALEVITLEHPERNDIRKVIEKLNYEALGSDALKRVEELVKKALETSIIHRALKAKAIQREYPLVMQTNGEIISGRVDLAFSEEDGIVIVDYKTDEISTEEEAKIKIKDIYITQGEFYSKIMQKALKTPIKEVYFLFLSPSPPIAVNILGL